MSNNTDLGRELGWNDTIENDSPEFTLLPEGIYDFEIVNLERARHAGSEKLPPCNKAVVHVRIEGNEGISVIKHNLFLHTRTEGLLCAFFTAIGQRKHGEKLTMNWNKVIGAKGKCKVIIDKFTNDKGEEKQYNSISKFIEPDEEKVAPTKKFEPGRF